MIRLRRSLRSRPAVRGIALIEALVGVLIFCIGILGLVGLQASLTRAQGSAKYRADAAYLVSDLLGQMWTDRANLSDYGSSACSLERCTAWVRKVESTLPAGRSRVQVSASGDVALTVTWSTSTEGTHQYVLETAIRN